MIDNDLTFTYSGIRSVSFDRSLNVRVYPNPVRDVLFVHTDHSQVKAITLTNLNGLKVYSGRGAQNINVKGLTDGVYVLTVTFNDNTVASQKVVLVK